MSAVKRGRRMLHSSGEPSHNDRASTIIATLDRVMATSWGDLADATALYKECMSLRWDHGRTMVDPGTLEQRLTFWREYRRECLPVTESQSDINKRLAAWTAANMPK